MGRSTLAEALLQEVRGAETGQATHAGMMFQCQRGDLPFVIWHRVLCWLLEEVGAADANSLAWLLGADHLGDGPPDLLACHVGGIAAMRYSGRDKTEMLQGLYADIISDAMLVAPLYIALDDVHRLGEEDLATLCGIATRLNTQRPTRPDTMRDWRSVLLCTTSRPIIFEPCHEGAPQALHSMEGVVHLQLGQLEKPEVLELAKLTLDCQSLDNFVAATIMTRCDCTPLHVVDLCKWLKREEMVEGGQLTSKATRKELRNLVPRGMTAIVQARVDQLPTSIGIVLRCASVLGFKFNAGVLHTMLPCGVGGDAEMLDYQLHALQEAQLIAPAVWRDYDRIRGKADATWEFSNVLHRDVVYSSLPHSHRRALHGKAAEALREQLSEAHGALSERQALRALVHHMQRAVRSGGGCAPSKRGSEQEREVLLLADTLIRAAKVSHSLGIYKEAFQYWFQVLDLLYEENTITGGTSCMLLMKESEAVDHVQNTITAVMLFDRDLIRALFLDHHAKLEELSARQEELMTAISETRNGAPDSAATFSAGSTLPLSTRVEATAVYQPFVEEMIANMGYMKPETWRRAIKEFYMGLPGWTAIETAYRGSLVIIVLQDSLPCWRFADLSETVYRSFQQAGSPYSMTEVGGYSIMIGIGMGLLNRICQGVVGGPSEEAANGVFEALEAAKCGFLAAYWECLEATWEPMGSPRVQRVRAQRVAAGSPMPPWMAKPECMDELHLAESAAGKLHGDPADSCDGGPSEGETLAALREHLAGANAAAQKSAITFALPLPRACVAGFCVRHGCALLFSGAAGALPSCSIAQLEVLCCALSCCLAEWADNGCNVHGEFTYFPATMMLGRTILHLLQWVLVSADCRKELPEAVTLLQGLHDWYPPESAGPHADGLRAVIGGLLLTQRIGVGRGELMPATIPATMVLARLLAGQSGYLTQHNPAIVVVVPVSLPATLQSGLDTSLPVEVRRVRLGSRAARQVALQHLTDFLQSVKVQGKQLDPDTVRSPSDMADSHSLWEAVNLHRELTKQHGTATNDMASVC